MPVIEYMKTVFGVDHVDMITEPGPIRILAIAGKETEVESIRDRVEISVSKHHSKLVALVGHYDCAGNPVGENIQLKQMSAAIKVVEAWRFEAKIIGLWIDEYWEVNEVGWANSQL